MKILFVNSLYPPHVGGGAEIICQTQVEGMRGRGHNVAVLTIGDDPHTAKLDTVNGIKVHRIPYQNLYFHYGESSPSVIKKIFWHFKDRYNKSIKPHVQAVMKQENPDIVITHNVCGFSIAIWDVVKEYKSKIPILHVLHDQYLMCSKSTMFRGGKICTSQCLDCKIFRRRHLEASNKVDAVVGVSRFILDHHTKHGYFSKVPILKVIYNARHPFSKKGQISNRDDIDNVTYGFIGSLAPNKGLNKLLYAFRLLERPDLTLVVAGRGKVAYEEALKKKYSNQNIKFVGYIKAEDFFSMVDVAVVPSVWNDTLPGVVFESFGMGVPVIASCRGGVPEMVNNGVNGLLFDPDQTKELQVAIVRMADDVKFRKSASVAARDTATMFLDMDRFLTSYEQLITDLCRKKN